MEPVRRRLLAPGSERLIVLYESLFDTEVARRLYDVYRMLPYRLADRDRGEDHHDIRHWNHVFEPGGWDTAAYCRPLTQLARTMVEQENLPAAEIDHVYANMNLFGDYQLSHADGNCWTILWFLNAEWRDNWGGEILFYGDRPSEALAVTPRVGGAILFDGEILHRGGVPSKLCMEPRITLAMKMEKL